MRYILILGCMWLSTAGYTHDFFDEDTPGLRLEDPPWPTYNPVVTDFGNSGDEEEATDHNEWYNTPSDPYDPGNEEEDVNLGLDSD